MLLFEMSQLYKKFYTLFFYILIILLFHFIYNPGSAIAENQGEFILINNIYPGMKGIGKTVFSGTKIEEFGVEVIDIIHGSGITNPFILVRLSGDRIEKNGGISAGMSGSPVYFEGKLAGAISHAWEMSEHNLCLITPIDLMVNLFNYAGKEKEEVNFNTSVNNNVDIVSLFIDESFHRKLSNLEYLSDKIGYCFPKGEKTIFNFQLLQSPLLVSTSSRRAGHYVEEILNKHGITLVENILEYQNIRPELEINTDVKNILPGSAIGVQLSTGDISIIGIGTATYCQDNYVLAFGHPFLHRGDVSYLFTSVYIYHSFPSIVMPFKIGSPYLLLGEVIQDRNAGILARLNKFPSIVSCKIRVNDLDRDIDMGSGVKIVPEKDIVQSVVPALLIQSVDNAINRIGEGTGTIRYSFRNAGTGEIINYNNIFFSENDVALEITKDLNTLFDLLYYNFYEKIDLNEIMIDVAIKKQNNRAYIKEVKLNSEDYSPGDEIEVQIKILPFRQASEQKEISIKLPDDINPGDAVLLVKGGSSKEEINKQSIPQNDQYYLLNGWSEIEKYLNNQEKNNQIITEIILLNDHEEFDDSAKSESEKNKNHLKTIIDTDFVMDGYQEIFLHIKKNPLNELE